MKKAMLLIAVTVALGCFAQNTDAGYPAGVRVLFRDGTAMQLICDPVGNCLQKANTSGAAITQINLGFSDKRGYILHIQ